MKKNHPIMYEKLNRAFEKECDELEKKNLINRISIKRRVSK